MYIPTPPAFVLEALLINLYPGIDMLLILLSLNLVSDMVIKLGDSLTVSRNVWNQRTASPVVHKLLDK